MHALPSDPLTLALLVFMLGVKHGFDADHLATIDGLTRCNIQVRPRLARFCGTLFSLGHGAVVVAVAVGVSLLSREWVVPEWLETSGAWVSIGFLALLGVLNIGAVLAAEPHDLVHPVGLKGRWLGSLARVGHPAGAALVGALFALSFDTVSQAALFAMAGVQAGGWEPAALLGLVFMMGMLLADGLNGLWIARLIARADEVALLASRIMALAVGGMSLVVAAYGLARISWPAVEAWGEGKELLLGIGLITCVLASFLAALRLARTRSGAARMVA